MNQEDQKQTPESWSPRTEEAKIVSTTYAPLNPPYQIIKWGGSVGMQIGTFIVTVQKPGNVNGLGYNIETHSHPVVAYENKERFIDPKKRISGTDSQLYSARIMEGTVWDNVELRDVLTVCLANAKLSWDSYVEFIRREVLDAPPGKLPNASIVYDLERLGGKVLPIGEKDTFDRSSDKKDLTVWLDHMITNKWGGRSMICTRKGSPIVLCADDLNGPMPVMDLFVRQLYKWAVLFFGRPALGGDFIKQPIRYVTDVKDEGYHFVINELNSHYSTIRDILEGGGIYTPGAFPNK